MLPSACVTGQQHQQLSRLWHPSGTHSIPVSLQNIGYRGVFQAPLTQGWAFGGRLFD